MKNEILYTKIIDWAGDLPSKYEALSSNPCTSNPLPPIID
jgi:hypothetical protein